MQFYQKMSGFLAVVLLLAVLFTACVMPDAGNHYIGATEPNETEVSTEEQTEEQTERETKEHREQRISSQSSK